MPKGISLYISEFREILGEMEHLPRVDTKYEKGGVNPFQYPVEYFRVQVQFAARWAQLAVEPFSDTLRTRTSIARRFDDNMPDERLSAYLTTNDYEDVTQRIFAAYIQQSSAVYSPERSSKKHEDFGFFGYDYYPNNSLSGGLNSIKVHFINTRRGESSGLAQVFAEQRRLDVRRMITSVVAEHPEANEVVGGSWLYNLPSYRDSYPAGFVNNSRLLVPPQLADAFPDAVPNMSFGGNSVWGQFIDRRGWAATARCTEFEASVTQAQTLAELYEALPLKPLQPTADPSVFLDWDLAA